MNIETYLEARGNGISEQLRERIESLGSNMIVMEQRTVHLVDGNTGELIDEYNDSWENSFMNVDNTKRIDDAVAALAQTTPVTVLWDTYGWYAPYIADDGSVFYESSAEEFDVQFTHEQHEISYETACEWAKQNELGSPIWLVACPVTVAYGTLQLFSHK